MSAPAVAGRTGPSRRPALSLVREDVGRDARPSDPTPPGDDSLRQVYLAVLADLDFPARRWQILAESDAWGATGPVHRLLSCLPEGCYRSLDSVVEMLQLIHRQRHVPPHRPASR